MSRICYVEADDTESFLRACAFDANTKRHLAGKKGQEALLELEAALLALPEKRLEYSKFAIQHGDADDIGGVCALGAVALKRLMDKGMSRAQAIRKVREEGPGHTEGWDGIMNSAAYLGCKTNFAWAVIEQNDEIGGPTSEKRYERVLEWVRKLIVR